MLLIQETWFNKDKGYCCGESDLYEPFTDNLSELYKRLMKEYGRCTGKVYIDQDGKSIPVGWVFEKRKRYEDCNDTFLAETWVTIHSSLPEKKVTHHYLRTDNKKVVSI